MSRLLAILTLETGLTGHDLSRIIASAPRRYKEFKMPKRQGGFRHMAQPAREVKALQRALVKHYLEKLPIHSSAMAYERGTSIRLNAERHAKVNGPILKLDFRDFFPSIRPSDWIAYAK